MTTSGVTGDLGEVAVQPIASRTRSANECLRPTRVAANTRMRVTRAGNTRMGLATVLGMRTRLTDLLDIEHPIMLAGMGASVTTELVAAVSEAGGIGTLGASTMRPRSCRPRWPRSAS